MNGVPARNDVLVEFFSSGFCPGGVAANFAGQWYNGKLTPDVATPVTVTVGNTLTGINAALSASGSFSGTVTAAAGGAPLPGICVAAYLPFAARGGGAAHHEHLDRGRRHVHASRRTGREASP